MVLVEPDTNTVSEFLTLCLYKECEFLKNIFVVWENVKEERRR